MRAFFSLIVNCSSQWEHPVNIFKSIDDVPSQLLSMKTNHEQLYSRLAREIKNTRRKGCNVKLPINMFTKKGINYYNASVSISFS